MTALTNAQFRLAARPSGLPKPSDWSYTEEPVGTPGEGEILVELESSISLDPAMRSWMNAGRSYVPPVQIGEVMRAAGIGKIVASKNANFTAGQHVYGTFGVQKFAISDGAGVSVVDTELAPAPVHLGALGLSGISAYFGLLDVGRPKPGETVVVSAAAGSVGSIAGQIAKIKGCRAIGIAGGADKCRGLVEELGFDAAIDYKAGDVRAQLREYAQKASMSSSTMSAAPFSKTYSRGSPRVRGSSSAERFRSTTTKNRPKARRTTCSCWSLALP